MDRLICTAFVGVLLLAALGCGAGSTLAADAGNRDGFARPDGAEFPGWSWTMETEYATLIGTSPVSDEVAALFRPQRKPSLRSLPALPKLDSFTRSASLTVQHELLGSEYLDHSGNAAVNGDSMVLNAAAGETSWAIYEFTGLAEVNDLQLLRIEASNDNFGGDDPGYWVGWADFSRDTWEIKSLTQHVNYLRTVGDPAKYLSGSGSFFCFVLIADGQGITINRVALDVDAGDWTEVAVDTGENRGWTPAMVFTVTGNPAVAYADLETGKPRWIIGNRAADLTIVSNWQLSTIEANPNGVAKWMDAVIDAEYQYPRVSMVFEGASGGSWNSTIGFALIAEPSPGSPVWGTYVVGDIDGAEYTSIDRKPVSGHIGIASMARNENRDDQADNDMHYRLFEIEDPNSGDPIPVTLKRGFQEIFPEPFPDPFAFKHPHLRYHPSLGNSAIVANGGYLLHENNPDEWANPYSVGAAGDFGSLAFNPANEYFGQTYNVTGALTSDLMFVEFSLSVPGSPEVVDSLPAGGGQRVGEVSQVAYTADGTPGIAYTVFDGELTRVMYAFLDGASWVSEEVSTDYMDNVGDATVHVDLAYDNDGTAAVCYNYVDGSNCELRVALRGL